MKSVPLTQAVTSGDAAAVSASIANGADVNERTGGGQTPLILATIFGHSHLIPILLQAGADPYLQDNLGLNAIEWAQRRGLADASEIFTGKANSSTAETKNTPARAPAPSETETKNAVSAEERSRRWLTGLKQRIAEQGPRDELDRSNIFRPKAEPPAEPPEPESTLEDQSPKPQDRPTQLIEPVPTHSSKRKRCPKCNAIYESDLLAYCAHHIVPLVDADAPIVSEPPKASPLMFWLLIVITFSGSIALASLLATYFFYRPNQLPPETTAAPAPVNRVQKGIPEAGPEFAGKVVSLPEAECPVTGPEPTAATIVVHVTVDRDGNVNSASATGGDWLLRAAATEAAMKSSFVPERTRRREIAGTITYTFK